MQELPGTKVNWQDKGLYEWACKLEGCREVLDKITLQRRLQNNIPSSYVQGGHRSVLLLCLWS